MTQLSKKKEHPFEEEYKLDMDHLKLNFLDYLFGMVFIFPNATFKWMYGLIYLKTREALYHLKLIKPLPGRLTRYIGQSALLI